MLYCSLNWLLTKLDILIKLNKVYSLMAFNMIGCSRHRNNMMLIGLIILDTDRWRALLANMKNN